MDNERIIQAVQTARTPQLAQPAQTAPSTRTAPLVQATQALQASMAAAPSASPVPAHLSRRTGRILRNPRAATPLILFMGFIGASLRYALELVLPANGGFPFATLAVNIFGCFVLELVNRYIGRRMHLPAPLVKSLGVGLIGAFTTLSAFSGECLSFIREGEIALAALYITATVVLTFAATLAGHATCLALEAHRLKRLQRRRASRRERL